MRGLIERGLITFTHPEIYYRLTKSEKILCADLHVNNGRIKKSYYGNCSHQMVAKICSSVGVKWSESNIQVGAYTRGFNGKIALNLIITICSMNDDFLQERGDIKDFRYIISNQEQTHFKILQQARIAVPFRLSHMRYQFNAKYST